MNITYSNDKFFLALVYDYYLKTNPTHIYTRILSRSIFDEGPQSVKEAMFTTLPILHYNPSDYLLWLMLKSRPIIIITHHVDPHSMQRHFMEIKTIEISSKDIYTITGCILVLN